MFGIWKINTSVKVVTLYYGDPTKTDNTTSPGPVLQCYTAYTILLWTYGSIFTISNQYNISNNSCDNKVKY